MGKYSYSPEITKQIDAVCKDPSVSIVLDFPTLSIDSVEETLKKVAHFLKDNYNDIGTNEYLLEIDFDIPGTNTLTSKIIVQELQISNNHFVINSDLFILASKNFQDGFSISSLAGYSRTNNCVLIFVRNGIELLIFSKGVPIKEMNVNFPTSRPVLNDKFSRSAEDYELSLKDFYFQKVRTNLTEHWHDKATRTLNGGLTESIFQNELTQWLIDKLVCKKIQFKVNKINKDQTDIEIIKHGGDIYIIEIKWLGKNKSNTSNSEPQLVKAIDQVKNYLDADPDILKITLAVYDARKETEFEKLEFVMEEKGNWKEINKCKGNCLPIKATGYIYFLLSESASKRKAS